MRIFKRNISAHFMIKTKHSADILNVKLDLTHHLVSVFLNKEGVVE